MGCEDQIVIPWVNQDIAHRNRGRVIFEPDPVSPIIVRHEQPGFGSDKQEVRIPRVLLEHMDPADLGKIAADRLPGLSEIGGHKNIGCKIIVPMPVEGDVRSAFALM